jgi:hypothetical protein
MSSKNVKNIGKNKPYNLGKFRISRNLFDRDFNTITEIFNHFKFVPVKVWFDVQSGNYEYTAFSPFFEDEKSLHLIPEYTILVTTYKMKTTSSEGWKAIIKYELQRV